MPYVQVTWVTRRTPSESATQRAERVYDRADRRRPRQARKYSGDEFVDLPPTDYAEAGVTVADQKRTPCRRAGSDHVPEVRGLRTIAPSVDLNLRELPNSSGVHSDRTSDSCRLCSLRRGMHLAADQHGVNEVADADADWDYAEDGRLRRVGFIARQHQER